MVENFYIISIVLTLAVALFSFHRFRAATFGTFEGKGNGPGASRKSAKRLFWLLWIPGIVLGFKMPLVGILLLWVGAISAGVLLHNAKRRLVGPNRTKR